MEAAVEMTGRKMDPASRSPVLVPKLTMRRRFMNQKMLHLMMVPAVATVVLFYYMPLYGLLLAFKNFNIVKGVAKSPWARNGGFEHFIDFFNSVGVGQVLLNTVALALSSLVFVQIFPVIFALLMNEIQSKVFKKFTQTVTYLPYFVSWIVVGGILFTLLLPTRNGPINGILFSLGLIKKPLDLMNDPAVMWPLFIATEIWKKTGWESIMYLAVIMSIDPCLYEAVTIDGGGRWTKMRHVTWPALKAVFMLLFIMKCGTIMSGGGFLDQSYIFGTASNKSTSQVLDVYIIRVGLEQARYSFAAAAGLFKQVVNLILLLAANTISRRLTGKGLF